ncbi:MAG TPA: carotenoid biosynthesis protein, partial [Cyclobacteriaceae bacterium]|nr:carotenoid biosynthesis protein [Cyclobacteriaceae bacterium]
SKLIKVLLGTALAVLLDVFIEPVAIHYDFWSWENITPPLQNYIGWFVVSSLLLVIFFQKPDRSSNKSAIAFLFIQLGFFALLNLRLMIAG